MLSLKISRLVVRKCDEWLELIKTSIHFFISDKKHDNGKCGNGFILRCTYICFVVRISVIFEVYYEAYFEAT